MSASLRSKQGCWTCRLRKKKCDESNPQCQTCTSLSIKCYGYGSKPDWMDSGERERAVANNIKQIAKYTWRRKATTRPNGERHSTVVVLALKSSQVGLDDRDELAPPSDRTLSVDGELDVTIYASSTGTQSKEQEMSLFGPVNSITPTDSILLMHFLDTVFPHQYPMYKPDNMYCPPSSVCPSFPRYSTILGGGRGWLLTILLRTKPLYHACLALSSYHRRMTIFSKLARPCQIASKVQQETHLKICLTDFRETMKSVNNYVLKPHITDELSTVTSIVQLIFFELFAGSSNSWKIHLLAGMNVYHEGCGSKVTEQNLTDSSLFEISGVPLTNGQTASTEKVATFRFEGGTLIWLDIIASVTSGTAPSLLPYHHYNIAHASRTKLHEIMGCKNWAMRLLARVSALQASKDTKPSEDVDHIELNEEADAIKREIQAKIAQENLEDSNSELLNRPTTSDHDITLITYLSAHSTQIYLHLITQNFTQLHTLQSAISTVSIMLQTQKIGTHLLPACVMPLFIVACVAGQGCEQELFRKCFNGGWIAETRMKHRERLGGVLEEIWGLRDAREDLVWGDVLEIVGDLLLI